MIFYECCQRTFDRDGASCVFGCGSVIDDDTRMCPTCRDHSAPMFECDTCARHWEQWGEEWEAEAPTVVTDDHADDWRPGKW